MLKPSSPRPGSARAAAIAVVCAAAAAFGACAVAAEAPISSDQFAPGWQLHSKALLNRGPGPDATTVWYVPANLPRGRYLVVNRHGEDATLIDGYMVDITSNPERDIHVVLPQYYGYVEVIPAADAPSAKNQRPKVRFDGP